MVFNRIHPGKHTSGLAFAVVCSGFLLIYHNHVLQYCLIVAGAIMRLSLCQWSSSEGYGWMIHKNRFETSQPPKTIQIKMYPYIVGYNVDRCKITQITICSIISLLFTLVQGAAIIRGIVVQSIWSGTKHKYSMSVYADSILHQNIEREYIEPAT